MKYAILILIVLCNSFLHAQSFSTIDIKKLAQKVNEELKGNDIGNGVTVIGCIAVGRTLVYQYNVPENWRATEKMKEEIIANYKEAGISELYFNNEINVDFFYYHGNKLIKKISVKSNEFSNLNFTLGNYVSIKGHSKAKGVNLKLKQPVGWEMKEGDRPNIVKKFVYKTNTYLILIKDYMMFLSRKEAQEFLNDKENINEILTGAKLLFKNSELLNYKVVTIDTYPAFEYTVKGIQERSGINIKMIMKTWMIFYEDKIIYLQCSGLDDKKFIELEKLYNLITNSIIFPEQYN